jgi:light-regulated signal transduction histidine kinase (bacteriophytochrome)
MRLRAHDGTQVEATVISRSVADALGGGDGSLLVIRDNSRDATYEARIRTLSQELARTSAELRRFLDVASHHLQEPLRNVVSYVQLLERKYRNAIDREADEYIEYVVDGAVWMKHIICDLVSYSTLLAEEHPQVAVDLEQVVGQVCRNLDPVVRRSGASVRCSPLPTIVANEEQMGRLFQDLVANGLKFCDGARPEIRIGVQRVDQGALPCALIDSGDGCDGVWLFSVKDNGIGVPREYAEKVFGIFERLQPRSRQRGTGIGLAICRRIVELHGGRIWMEPNEGAGTTFFFALPIRRVGHRNCD